MDVLPTIIHAQVAAHSKLRDMLRSAGATSPRTAVAGKDLPPVDAASFDYLLKKGVIREGAPGTFYLYEESGTPKLSYRRGLVLLLVWMALILVPVAAINFCAGSP